MQNEKIKGISGTNPKNASSNGKAAYAPLDFAMEHGDLTGKRASFVKETSILRKTYLEELRQDLDEVMDEIIREDSLKKALSLLNTKYALERTILAEERNVLAEERTLLGEKRTKASGERTEMAENRSGLARIRTFLAKNRSFLSEKRTLMAQQRTFLAKARTELAFIRTGVAFLALATGLMRYFGFGWWTVMDASILLLGAVMVITGIYYYIPTRRKEGRLLDVIKQKEEELMRRKPRVLVLDDDPAVCNMLQLYLEKSGYHVEAFTNPFVAKQRLETIEFDVAITDLMMEGMDGIQILRLIKRISANTRVIMISRMQTPSDTLETIREDLFDYFSKPVDIKELQESVKRALEENMGL